MGGYRVDPVVIDQVDAALGACAGQAHAELQRLRAAALEVLGGWHGEGGAAFGAAWHDWHAGVLDLLTALGDMGRSLGLSGSGYATTEDAVRASLLAR